MNRDPSVPTRIFPVPKGFPPPVKIGDKLDGGVTIGPLCDRFEMGGKTIWRFYVSEPGIRRRMARKEYQHQDHRAQPENHAQAH
jgi:hypothetical protein